jgi:hypothetical protein
VPECSLWLKQIHKGNAREISREREKEKGEKEENRNDGN